MDDFVNAAGAADQEYNQKIQLREREEKKKAKKFESVDGLNLFGDAGGDGEDRKVKHDPFLDLFGPSTATKEKKKDIDLGNNMADDDEDWGDFDNVEVQNGEDMGDFNVGDDDDDFFNNDDELFEENKTK